MIRRSRITFCAAMLGIILLATGAAYAQRGGGGGGHGGGYQPTPPSKVTGTSKPIKCQAGGAGCMKQK
ncbi:MAG TPA: hypothetical protein VNU65_07855 [Xanthobacteraceae bacterium]|nr:hypothetical protein [Xanthobacteraceae bacterium]